MRKKLIWIIAIIVGALAFAITLMYVFDSGNLLPGVENSSAFIERFNAGNPPDGIELDDTITEDSFYGVGGFVCRVVPIVGNDDLCFRVYSRKKDGEVYAIRIDEAVSVYTEPTRLVEINQYLYSDFFKYASKDEREVSAYELEPITLNDGFFNIFYLDFKYLNRLSFGDALDQTNRFVRTVIYSCLSPRYTEDLTYPN